jgi:hypothetical protein
LAGKESLVLDLLSKNQTRISLIIEGKNINRFFSPKKLNAKSSFQLYLAMIRN